MRMSIFKQMVATATATAFVALSSYAQAATCSVYAVQIDVLAASNFGSTQAQVQQLAGVEPLRVEAMRTGDARFAAAAAPLPLAGPWQVRADLLVDDFTKLMSRTRIEVAR
jgi:hypothetical protein